MDASSIPLKARDDTQTDRNLPLRALPSDGASEVNSAVPEGVREARSCRRNPRGQAGIPRGQAYRGVLSPHPSASTPSSRPRPRKEVSLVAPHSSLTPTAPPGHSATALPRRRRLRRRHSMS